MFPKFSCYITHSLTGEIYQPQDISCCWECKPCRGNEIVIDDARDCLECVKFEWPNYFRNSCQIIEPFHMSYSDPTTLVVVGVTIGLLVLSFICIGLFFTNHKHKLIKASGRELMSLVFLGVVLGFSTNFALLATPTKVLCDTGMYVCVCMTDHHVKQR